MLEGRHREALEAATAALSASHDRGEVTLRLPLLERLLGYAHHQGRRPDEARVHFEASLQHAREQASRFDEAATLKALADTGLEPERRADAAALLASLGVVAAPRVPLP